MKHFTKKIERQEIADSGFTPDQFIYMEREYHPELNNLIKGSLAYIEDEFSFRSRHFVYLPEMAKAIAGQEYLDYIVPTGERTAEFTTPDAFNVLFNGIEGMPQNPFLMRCGGNGTGTRVEIWEFESREAKAMRAELLQFINGLGNFAYTDIQFNIDTIPGAGLDCEYDCAPGSRCFSTFDNEEDATDWCFEIAPTEEEEEKPHKKKKTSLFGEWLSEIKESLFNTDECLNDTSDDSDDNEDVYIEQEEKEVNLRPASAPLPIKVQWETNVKDIGADALFNDIMASEQYIEATNKIYEGIKELHKLGIGSLVIRSIAGSRNLLSRIRIDDDFNITLPDYNNMRIEMAPMTKALYLLFLRHEEGIAFKELPGYRGELTALYWDLIESDDEENVLATIERVTDPFNNDINVHCSRIKAAFTLKFENALASNYYIYGKRGEPKRISLPRNLVEWSDIAV